MSYSSRAAARRWDKSEDETSLLSKHLYRRIEDLTARMEALQNDSESESNYEGYSENNLRMILPKDLCSIHNIIKALQLAEFDLAKLENSMECS